MPRGSRKARPAGARQAAPLRLAEADVSLLDVIDHVLTQGVVLSGELRLGVADVDLIYIRLLALICSSDRVAGDLPGEIESRPSRAARRLTRG